MTSNLDDVLDAYAASDEGPSREALEAWVRRYPEYEQELAAFTVDWLHLHHVTAPAPADDEETLVLRGMSVVHQILHARRLAPQSLADAAAHVGDSPASPASLTAPPAPSARELPAADAMAGSLTTVPRSLFGVAAERGLSADALAAATGLTVTLLRALSNRTVVAASVPLAVVDALGRALGRARSAILEYLALPTTLTAAAAYKADRAPKAPTRRTFAELVRMDPELTDSERNALLALCGAVT